MNSADEIICNSKRLSDRNIYINIIRIHRMYPYASPYIRLHCIITIRIIFMPTQRANHNISRWETRRRTGQAIFITGSPFYILLILHIVSFRSFSCTVTAGPRQPHRPKHMYNRTNSMFRHSVAPRKLSASALFYLSLVGIASRTAVLNHRLAFDAVVSTVDIRLRKQNRFCVYLSISILYQHRFLIL